MSSVDLSLTSPPPPFFISNKITPNVALALALAPYAVYACSYFKHRPVWSVWNHDSDHTGIECNNMNVSVLKLHYCVHLNSISSHRF